MKRAASRVLAVPAALAGPTAVVVGVTALASAGTFAQQRTVTLMLVHLVFVVGLYVFIGNSGVLSFGHASFMVILIVRPTGITRGREFRLARLERRRGRQPLPNGPMMPAPAREPAPEPPARFPQR